MCKNDHCTAGLRFNYALDLTKEENTLFLEFTEAAESNLVKLQTNHTVILPHTVSVLWL